MLCSNGRMARGANLGACVVIACVSFGACGHGNSATGPTNGTGTQSPATPSYDVARLGVPKFVNTIYIDLSQINPATGLPLINQISTFRSSVRHDYSDSFETCRSMKHYFVAPNSSTRLYAPVAGTVVRVNTSAFGYRRAGEPRSRRASHARRDSGTARVVFRHLDRQRLRGVQASRHQLAFRPDHHGSTARRGAAVLRERWNVYVDGRSASSVRPFLATIRS